MLFPSRIVRTTALLVLLLVVLTVAGLTFAAPVAAQTTGIEVFALQGSLRQAIGQPFTSYLVVAEGGRAYGLYGRTPEVDQQIEAYRLQGVDVKVWGILYEKGRLSDVPEIVVETIAPAGVAPTPTPTVRAGVSAAVNVQSANVRSGPSTAYPAVGALAFGTICTANGRNGDISWLRLACSGLTGWVARELLIVSGDAVNLPVPPVGPPPVRATPTPPSLPYPDWSAAYYANRDLSGAPVITRNERFANLEWGGGSPDPRIPTDNFSMRLERVRLYSSQLYRISATVDDGVRVWLNNDLVIDDWREGPSRTLTVERRLSGNVFVRVEYFDAYGDARLILRIDPASQPEQAIPEPGQNELQPQVDRWAAAYWNNRSFSGRPRIARYEARSPYPLDLNWGNGSPVSGPVPADNFAARWVGVFPFAGGDHTFKATADDGVRVKIDGITIIDAWYDGHKALSNTFRQIGAGNHTITVEFYEGGGTAYVQVLWYRETDSGGGGGGGGSGGGGSGGGGSRDE